MEQFHRITLDEYASPSFCSFTKEYVGTREMLNAFADALCESHSASEQFREIADGIHQYKANEDIVTAHVAYNEIRLLSAVQALHATTTEESPFYFEHTNVWGFPYFVRAQQVRLQRLWYRIDDCYRRAIGASFFLPCYGSEQDDLTRPLGEAFWGHPGILYMQDGWLSSRLMYEELAFAGEEELNADIASPADVDCKGFFDDVFGDG